AAILFILDFFMIRSANAGGHIAHIGGALFGLLYAMSLRKGFSFKRVSNPFRKASRPGIKYPDERPLSDDEFNMRKAVRQKRIDIILDKISKSGYESLSEEDKEILFRAGKK
ncbi:MAG: rhomboid family intramembrane serine protease, partial [Bacteroidales bacterium]|nr:rhomboid family intramembrane serine protease [Bacteroidales bacterium]